MADQLYSMAEAAEKLGVSRITVWRMKEKGHIGHVKVRDRVLIRDSEIQRYIEDHSVPARAEGG